MVAMVDALHSGYSKIFEELLGNNKCQFFELRYFKVPEYISVSVGA